MKNKILRLAVLTLTSALLFVGCSGKKTPAVEAGESNSESTSPSSDMKNLMPLASDGKANFVIIRNRDASTYVSSSIFNFASDIRKIGSLDDPIVIQHDKSEQNSDKIQLIVGKTSLPETAALLENIPSGSGWGVRVTGKKVIIAATDDTFLADALYWFADELLERNDPTLSIPADLEKLEEALPYDKRPISDTFQNKKLSLSYISEKVYVAEPYSGCNAGQGACTDGEYIYVSLLKIIDYQNSVFNVRLKKIRASDMSVVKVSEILPLDHCNDLCYNPKTNEIIAVNMIDAKISVINPDDLTLKRTFDLPTGGKPYCISYEEDRDGYLVISNGQVYELDSEFRAIKSSERYINNNYVAQGLHSYGNIIYMPMSKKTSAGTDDNIVIVFNRNNPSRAVCELHILGNTDEIETLFTLDGQLYAVYNNKNPAGGGSVISKLILYREYK